MTKDRKLQVAITGDARGAQKAFKDTEDDASSWGQKVKGKLADVGPMLQAGALAGVAAVGAFGVASYNAAVESQKIAKETSRVIETTGAAAWTSADQVSAYAGKLSELTGVDDEVIQSGENVMLTFTNVKNRLGEGNDVFDRATALALDMSTALGGDLQGSILQVGKALNDPIKGMSALSRAGVSFTQQQKDQVRALQESGDMLGAQKIILDELAKEFGGAAEAAATPLDKLMVKVGNVQEAFGARLIPVVDGAVSAIEFLSGAVTNNDAVFVGLSATVAVLTARMGMLAATQAAALFEKAAIAAYEFAGAVSAGNLSLTTMQSTMLASAIAVAGLTAAWKLWDRALDDSKDNVSEVGQGIRESMKTDSLDEMKRKVREIDNQIGGLQDSIGNSSDLAFWDADYRAELSMMGAELQATGTEMQQMIGNAEALAAATGLSGDEALRWLQIQAEQGQVFPTMSEAVAAYTGTVDENTMSTMSAVDAAKELNDTLRAQVDPLFAVQDAQERLNAAKQKTLEALNAHGAASPEYISASQAQTRAAFDLTYATTTLNGAVADAPGLLDGAKAGLDRMAQQGHITQQQADQMKNSFVGATWEAAALGQQNVNVPVNANASGFWSVFDSIQAAIANARIGATVTINGNKGTWRGPGLDTSGLASGGSMTDGWTWVGEEGPELAHKSGSSVQVFSAGKSASMVAQPSQSITVVVQAGNVVSESSFVEMVAQGLRQAQRTTPYPILQGVQT